MSDSIGELEHLVLLTILNHPEDASALAIRRTLEAEADRAITRGALYRSLDRLGEKGMLEWDVEAPTAERGGHTKRLYRLSASGLDAVRHRRNVLERLWSGAGEALG